MFFLIQVTPHRQYQLDILDLSRYAKSNKKIRFCLVAICTMSRFAYTFACQSKSALEILKHVKTLYASRKSIKVLQSDEGIISFISSHCLIIETIYMQSVRPVHTCKVCLE